MVTEIELKAHVRDSEALRLILLEKAESLGTFEKEDSYWFGAPGLPLSGLRVRREKSALPDGTVKEAVFAAYKAKEVSDGIEINDEQEFEVSPVQAFEEFLGKMGLKPGFSKRKRGFAFCKISGEAQIRAELVEVSESGGLGNLGWFIELEILAGGIQTGNRRAETLAEAKNRLLDFLSCLGIEKEAIESRFYSEMLKENANVSQRALRKPENIGII